MKSMLALLFTLVPLVFAVGPIFASMKSLEARGDAARCALKDASSQCLEGAVRRHQVWNDAVLEMTGEKPARLQ